MPDFSKITEKLKELFPNKKLMTIVFLGIAGMLMILISQYSAQKPVSATPDNPAETQAAQSASEEYIAALEEKLIGLITSIEGVGRARVMVTLENGGEYVYAQEEKRNTDKNTDSGGDGYTKENIQQSYILMNGQKEALVRTYLEPKVQGVAIICEGAGNIRVKQSIINVVTTALNIPTTRVCVEKIA